MLKFERKLREQLEKLASQLDETRNELNLTAEHIENVVRVGLELASQPPLVPVKFDGIWPDPNESERPARYSDCPLCPEVGRFAPKGSLIHTHTKSAP